MRLQWQQFSPAEKEAILRHYILHQKSGQVSPEKVCQVMRETHFLTCVSPGNGKTLVEFVSSGAGANTGAAIASDLTEGIYKAALRAQGVELVDDPNQPKSGPTRQAGKVTHL